MALIDHIATQAPEVFLILALAIGTMLGRLRLRGFAIGATACTLIVAVLLGQFGTFVIPPLLKSIFFGLFMFTIGYRSGPEFFASLSVRTLGHQVHTRAHTFGRIASKRRLRASFIKNSHRHSSPRFGEMQWFARQWRPHDIIETASRFARGVADATFALSLDRR